MNLPKPAIQQSNNLKMILSILWGNWDLYNKRTAHLAGARSLHKSISSSTKLCVSNCSYEFNTRYQHRRKTVWPVTCSLGQLSRWRRRGRSLREVFFSLHLVGTIDLSGIYNDKTRGHDTSRRKLRIRDLVAFLTIIPQRFVASGR